jgi:hypothetical protein
MEFCKIGPWPSSPHPDKVQWRPKKPGLHTHVPFLHWPLAEHRESQVRSWFNW